MAGPGDRLIGVAHYSSTSQITLNWVDNSDNETQFAIWRKSGSGSYTRVGVVAPNSTSYTDFGLNPNTTYTYRVRACNDFYASGWTNEASSTTLQIPPPAAPTNLTAVVTASKRVNLAWTDNSNNETAFSIWRKSGTGDYVRIALVPANTTRFTDTSMSLGVTYTYKVRAANDFFASAFTNEMSATPGP